MLAQKDLKLVQRLLDVKGVIDVTGCTDALRVYPNGDRRRRQGAFWIDQNMLKSLLASDALERTEKGYVVRKTLARRIRLTKMAGASKPQISQTADQQHYDLQERDVYTPDGVIRSANINHNRNALEKLARKRGRDGRLILSAAEVEAGRRLAKDYALAGEGIMATQNYDSAMVDGGRRHDAQEKALLASMTAKTRLTAAKAAMGEGLDRAVLAVCCHGESLDSVERAERWVKSSGLSILKIGLARLVTLYGTEAAKR